MPRKIIFCWLNDSRPVGRPLTIIHHTYLDTLCRFNAIQIDDVYGRVQDWFPLTKDKIEWEKIRESLLSRDRELGN